MSAITYDTIKIVGVPYSKLLSLEITHFPNQHGTAKMTGSMRHSPLILLPPPRGSRRSCSMAW